MKVTSVVGILVSSIALTSCAPIAASSPKLAQQRRGDSGVIDSGLTETKFDFSKVARSEIISAEKYEAYEKTLGDYKLDKISEVDEQFFELREKRSIKNLEVRTNLNRTELVAIFVVNLPEEELPVEKDAVKVKWIRDENDLHSFSLSIDESATSEEAWAIIKKNLTQVTIAYRTIKTEKK